MSKYCPHCNCSTEVIKFGITSAGRQRYRCETCKKTWTNKPRPDRLKQKIWDDFVFNNMPVRVLANKYHKHQNTIRGYLNDYTPPALNPASWTKQRKEAITVVALDATYFGRKHGVVVIIDAHTGDLLYFHEIHKTETNYEYLSGVDMLAEAGIHPKACVIDGRTGLAGSLEHRGLLVQMCHFHMWQISRRYLTLNPILEPNIELKTIMDLFISRHYRATNKASFAGQMQAWHDRNLQWLNERHRNEAGRLEYSHEDTRRLYKAIHSHFPYLFTYETYPELNIPKTSNIIEGKFGNAKDKLKLHHGYTDKLKTKIFFSLLSGRTGV